MAKMKTVLNQIFVIVNISSGIFRRQPQEKANTDIFYLFPIIFTECRQLLTMNHAEYS